MARADAGPATALSRLTRRAKVCRRCATVAPGSAVIGRRNGPAPAPLLFVAEAPGYLGGVRTGIPLLGDRSGRNFRHYCAEAGIDPTRAFICNAVLCHPPSADGRNRAPRVSEVVNCGDFLERIVALVDPLLVVALGRVALEALGRLEPHDLAFGDDTAQPVPWNQRQMISLYHPSSQTLGRRSAGRQIDDYRIVRRTIERLQAPRSA